MRNTNKDALLAFSVGLALGLASTGASAGPEGGVVTGGSGTITQGDATTTIGQSTNFLSIDWQSFNVAANESVLFRQPGRSSVALNRILDQNPSQIFGTVNANGQLFLINTNGILFGRTAQLNVGSLVASSLDVMSYDARSGHYVLGGKGGAIVNDGSLLASPGGSISLVGGSVANNGLIVADYGTVNLGSGNTATLDFFGGGLMRFEIDGEVTSGSGVAVSNTGTIQANGGQVFLTAQAAQGVFDRAINNEGIIRANRIANVGGTIRLLGPDGIVTSSGVLDASGVGANSTGGQVSVLGDRVGLFGNALVDVSGNAGGGTALIGGDYQGKNPKVLNSNATYVGGDATIRADAGSRGNGGRVIVWSDGSTVYRGTISANGGRDAGNGGFAEVSGKRALNFDGDVRLASMGGALGTLLLDPDSITIVAMNGADDAEIDDGSYLFDDDTGVASVISAQRILDVLDGTVGGGSNVVLEATDFIDITVDVDASGRAGAAGRSLTFLAGGNITLQDGVDVITNDGDITMRADFEFDPLNFPSDGMGTIIMVDDPMTAALAGVDAGTGNVILSGAEDITLLEVAGNNVSITSTTGAILDDGDDGTRIAATGLVTLNAATNIGTSAASANVDTDTASLTAIAGTGDIFIGEADDVTIVTINAGGGAGDAQITTAGNILDDGDNTTRITADNLGFIADSFGTAAALGEIDTTINSLDGAATAGGIFVGESNGIQLNSLSATTSNVVSIIAGGAITDDGVNGTRVTASNLTLSGTSIGATGANGQIDTTATSLNATATAGDIFIGETDALQLNAISASGNATIAATGALTDDASQATRVAANLLTLSGTVIGAAAANADIDTSATALDVTATTGGIFVNELDSLTGGVTAQSTNQTINLRANGLTTLITVNSGSGLIDIDAGAGQLNDGAVASVITTGNAILDGASIGGGPGNRLDTNVGGSLNVVADTGTIFLNEASGLTQLTAATTDQLLDITANGNVVLNTVNAGTGAINLNVGAGTLTDGGAASIITSGTATLRATTIGTSTGSRLDTNVGSLDATATTGGIFVAETNGLAGFAAGTTNQAIDLLANGNVVLTNVNAGMGAVDIDAQTGSITDAGAVTTLTTTGTATLSGTRIGTDAANQLNTNVNTLDATGTAGGIFVASANDITLANAVAAGEGINVSTGAGDIVVGGLVQLNGGVGNLDLTAADQILDNGAVNSRIENNGTAANLLAGTSIGTVGTGIFDVEAISPGAVALVAGGVDLSSNLFSARISGAGNGDVNLNVLGGLGVGNPASAVSVGSGNLVLQSTSSLSPAALLIELANNQGSVALISTGSIDLPAASMFETGNPNNFVIRGATDVTQALGRTLDLNALNIFFTSGGAGGLTNLNTLATSFSGDVGAADLRVTEGDNLVLRNVVANTLQVTSNGASLLDDGSAATRLVASTVGLTAAGGNIGTAASRVGTNATAVTVNAGGAVFLNELDAVTFGGSGSAIDLLAGGNVTLQNTTAVTTLAINSGGAITRGSGTLSAGLVDLDATNAIGTGANAIQIVNAGTVDATSTTSSIDLTIAVPTTELRSVSATGAVNIAQTAGDMRIGSVVSAGAVSLNAAGGIINATGGTGVSAGNVTLTAARIGAAGDGLITNATSLNIAANGAAAGDGVSVNEANAVTLTSVTTAGAGAGVTVNTGNGAITATSVTTAGDGGVTLNAGGNGSAITVGAINAGTGNVTLVAGAAANRGAVTDGAVGTAVTAGNLTVQSSTIGTAGNRLDTNVVLLATNTTGDQFVSEANGLVLNAVAGTGAVNVTNLAGVLNAANVTGTGATLNSPAGSILLGTVNVGGGNASVTTNGTITDGPATSVTANALTLQGSSIGSAVNRLDTAVNSITSTTTGDTFLADQGTLTLTSAAGAGTVNATSTGAMTVTSVTAGSTTLQSSGAMTLGTVNVGGGAASLTATAGALTDGAVGTAVTAGSLTITAGSVGASNNRLDTSVASLTATTSGGGMFVRETNAIQLNALTASGAGGAIDILALGAITQSANFTSNHGAIVIDGTSIAMTPTAVTSTGSGADITYFGRTGDVTLGLLDSVNEDVFVAAGDSILGNGTAATDIRAGRVELRVGAAFAGGAGTAPLLGETSAGDVQSIHITAPISGSATVFIVVPADAAGNQLTQPAIVFGGTNQGAKFTTPLSLVGVNGFFDSTSAFRILAPGQQPFPGAVTSTDLLVADSALTGLSLSQASASDIREYIDWSSFDPNVSLFGTIGQPVRLPADQLEEEEQVTMVVYPTRQTLVMTRDGLRMVKVYRPLGLAEGERYFN